MRQLSNSEKLKLFVYVLVASLFLSTSLIVTLIAEGQKSLDQSAGSLSNYFIQKYVKSTEVSNHRHLAFASIAVILLIMSIITVFCSQLKHKDYSTNTKRPGRIIYIVVSGAALVLVPITLFYISLICEKLKIDIKVQWNEILITIQSSIALITLGFCWKFSVQLSYKEESSYAVQQNKELFISKQSQDRKLYQSQIKRFEKEHFIRENMFNTLLVNKQSQNREDREETSPNEPIKLDQNQRVCQEEILRQNQTKNPLLLQNILPYVPSSPTLNDPSGQSCPDKRRMLSFYRRSSTLESADKIRSTNQLEKLHKQKLKNEIQKKKEKYRILRAKKIKRLSQEQYQESQEVPVKLCKLPKTYRQYIKEAKMPKRVIKSSSQFQELTKSAQQLPSPALTIQQKINPIQSIKKTDSRQQLLFTFKLKGKLQNRKKLFQNKTLWNESPITTRQERKAKKKKSSKQQQLMSRLKQRYFEMEDDQ